MAFFRKNYLNFQHLDLQIYPKECNGPFRQYRHHDLQLSGTRLTFTSYRCSIFGPMANMNVQFSSSWLSKFIETPKYQVISFTESAVKDLSLNDLK